MEVHCLLQLPATAFRWRFSSGAWRLTVVAKATFDLLPMKAARSSHQEPVQPTDAHYGGDAGQSLRIGSDLAPYKPRTDIVVVGSAYAPGGRPTRQLTARIVLGDCEKVVEVLADRTMSIDGAVQDGPPFASMPLVYERAAGGPDTWNPVGISKRSRDATGRLRLPNLIPPGSPPDAIEVPPIGFGPVAPTWSARMDWLGAHAGHWRHGVYGEDLVVPDDLDLRYFNIAPADQQLSTPVAPGAHLLFDCLTASGSRLSTYLPDLNPFAVATLGSRQEKLPMTADTFVVDSDRATCTITYRSVFPLQGPHEKVSIAIIDGSGSLATPLRQAPIDNEHSKTPELETMTGSAAADGPTMPFQKQQLPQVIIRPPADSVGLPFAPPPSPPGPATASKGLMQLGAVPSFQTVEVPLNVPPQPVPPAPPPPRSSPGVATPPPPPAPVAVLAHGPLAVAPPAPPLAPPPPMPQPAPPPLSQPAPPPPVPQPPTTTSGVPLRSMLLQGATEAQQPTYLKSEASPQRPAMVQVGHAARAAKDGALAASDAAAGTTTAKSTPPPAKTEPRVAPVEQAPAADTREYLELLWADPQAVHKARRSRTFRDLFVEKKVRRGVLAPTEETSAEAKDRMDLSRILSTPRPSTDIGSVDLTLSGALDEHGSLEPPYIVVAGDLVLLLDERVLLEAICGIIQPLLAKDKALAEAHELAKTALEGTWTMPRSIEQALKKLREALSKDVQGGIEASARRQVLERKDLEQRAVLGTQHVRASFAFSETQSMTMYLPASMKDRLPLYERFPVRVLATVHPRQDPLEASQSALVAEAVARRIPRPGNK